MAKITLSELRNVIRKIILKESNLSELETETETNTLTDKAQVDLPLIQAAKAGDQKALNKLISKYQSPLRFYVMRALPDKNEDDIDDVVSMIFVKVWKNIQKFDESFAFSTWLYNIAKNTCIDFMRKKKVDTTSLSQKFKDGDDEVAEPIVVKDKDDTPEQALQRKQVYEKLKRYIDKLNPTQQELIKMRYYDNVPYEEMASTLNMPLNTLKVNLFRAKEALAAMVKPDKDMKNENKKPKIK